MRVLLVEDGPDNQLLISHIVRKAGAEVAIVSNGIEALEAVDRSLGESRPFDIILMDMQMPRMDGYTATARLRAQGWSRPVIALTAHAMEGDRQKCLSAGCDEYLAKPVNRALLLRVIADYQTRAAAARVSSRGALLGAAAHTVQHEANQPDSPPSAEHASPRRR
jgi:CheY-like chemotaxis protein